MEVESAASIIATTPASEQSYLLAGRASNGSESTTTSSNTGITLFEHR